jgi:hypothetical protein
MKRIAACLILIVCLISFMGCFEFESYVLALKRSLYIESCNNIANAINAVAAGNDSMIDTSTLKSVSKLEDLYIEASPDEYIMVKMAAAYVEMLSEMLGNPKFKITDSPIKFTCSYAPLDSKVDAVLLYKFDEDNNRVVLQWDVEDLDTKSNSVTDIILYLGVDYNFVTKKVDSFEVYSRQKYSGESHIVSWRYKNRILSKIDTSKDMTQMENLLDSYEMFLSSKSSETVDLKADFTKEYTNMMNKFNNQ